jgi:hypothetical protein
MTTIILTDADKATQAGAWAVKNIGYKHWQLSLESLFHNTQYHFKFTHKKDAMLFSLKWM